MVLPDFELGAPLLEPFHPSLVYRGVVWQALIEVFDAADAAPGLALARSAAPWIRRTAAGHVPPAFKDSFLRGNPCNAFVLARAGQGITTA